MRPRYEDGDFICPICGEPWEAYATREALKGEISDMSKDEAEVFMRGKGCPSSRCKLLTAAERLKA